MKLKDLSCEVEDFQGKLGLAEEANQRMKEKYELEKEALDKKVWHMSDLTHPRA